MNMQLNPIKNLSQQNVYSVSAQAASMSLGRLVLSHSHCEMLGGPPEKVSLGNPSRGGEKDISSHL